MHLERKEQTQTMDDREKHSVWLEPALISCVSPSLELQEGPRVVTILVKWSEHRKKGTKIKAKSKEANNKTTHQFGNLIHE